MRLAALFASLTVLATLVVATRLYVTAALIAALALLQAFSLVRLVARTNRELGRFLGAIRFDDLQQSFSLAHLGAAFADLEGGFRDVLGRFRDARLADETQRRTLEALVEHVPVAILAVHEGGTVDLLNGAARRLLDASGSIRLERLHAYGAVFQRDIAQCKTGDRRLTRIEIDGVHRQLILSTTEVVAAGAPLRVVALEDIQSELDSSELSAWRDMAHVLSHEIMGSLTPIASLARTADELVDDLPRGAGHDEIVTDLRAAVRTVARRSDGLMRFVSSYREITQLPPPSLRPIELADTFARLRRLLLADWGKRGVELHVGAPPAGLSIVADEALLDQALINLLRNAADAASSSAAPAVWLDARLSERGRPVIEIGDNGPGIDESLGDKIFLPFFTTKPDGSGIGLALARQVMLVHRGAITATARAGGGALFRLSF